MSVRVALARQVARVAGVASKTLSRPTRTGSTWRPLIARTEALRLFPKAYFSVFESERHFHDTADSMLHEVFDCLSKMEEDYEVEVNFSVRPVDDGRETKLTRFSFLIICAARCFVDRDDGWDMGYQQAGAKPANMVVVSYEWTSAF